MLGEELMQLAMSYDEAMTADSAKLEETDQNIESIELEWTGRKQKLAQLIRSLTTKVQVLKQDALSADPEGEHEDQMRQLRSEQSYVRRQLEEIEINLQHAKTRVASVEAEKDAIRNQMKTDAKDVDDHIQPQVQSTLQLYSTVMPVKFNLVKGGITGYMTRPDKHDVRTFDLDPNMDPCTLSDTLWDMLD